MRRGFDVPGRGREIERARQREREIERERERERDRKRERERERQTDRERVPGSHALRMAGPVSDPSLCSIDDISDILYYYYYDAYVDGFVWVLT